MRRSEASELRIDLAMVEQKKPIAKTLIADFAIGDISPRAARSAAVNMCIVALRLERGKRAKAAAREVLETLGLAGRPS
jgi:hypothetical protein